MFGSSSEIRIDRRRREISEPTASQRNFLLIKPWPLTERDLELGTLETMRILLAKVSKRKMDFWDHLSFPRVQANRDGGSENVTQKKACLQERKENACQTRPIRLPSYLGQSVASMEANSVPNRSFQKMKSMHPDFSIAERL
jgi:hypothetical protein